MEKTVIEYRVPYADTDQMGVVYYANYFVFFERLRNELIRKSGVTYLDVEKKGLMYPVIEAYCQYLEGAKYDDLLMVYGWVVWVKGSRFKIKYEIICSDRILVKGFTIHNTINKEGRSRRVPDHIIELIIESEEENPD